MPEWPLTYSVEELAHIASHFDIPAPVRISDFPDRGNIHEHTYLLACGPPEETREYLLQAINQKVFTRPDNTMAAMLACLAAQQETLRRNPLPNGDEWRPITLVPTHDGCPYLKHPEQRGLSYWRLMERIPCCRTYKSLSEISDPCERLNAAEQAGRGLAIYLRLTEAMDVTGLQSPLPGYRDTRLYYSQLLSVLEGCRTAEDAARWLPADEILLHSAGPHFLVSLPEDRHRARMEDPDLQPYIQLAREMQDYGLTLLDRMEQGEIRTVAIHGDPKIENFLFCKVTGRVKALVDLDTIMPHSWLVDWGDMARSLVNVAGEKETDLSRVQVDERIYESVSRGFLSEAANIPAGELDLMTDAVSIIALELGIRFLADYLRGDTYFLVGPSDPPDLNKTRAMVQLTLFERLREKAAWSRAMIASLAAQRPERVEKASRW